jgi:hypothetical protein
VAQLEGIDGRLHVAQSRSALEELANRLDALDSPGDLVDILRLDNGLEVIFKKLGEVVCGKWSDMVLGEMIVVHSL